MTQIVIQITIGSSPDLLDHYVVAWSFSNRSKTYLFDASGGVIQETILLEDSEAIPAFIPVDITVDFKPHSKIPGYRFTQEMTQVSNIYSYFFEIGQIIQAVVLCFDLPWPWVGKWNNDYLFIEWEYSENGSPLYTGVFLIKKAEFANFITKTFCFLQDPKGTNAIGDIKYEITGRLRNLEIEKFQKNFSLPNAQFIVLRPEFQSSSSKFLLKVIS